MMRSLKVFAATKASQLYLHNKATLWRGYRHSCVIDDAAQCLRHLLPQHIDVTPNIVSQCIAELESASPIRESVERYEAVIGKGWEDLLRGVSFAAILYCYVALRLTKPEVVVETGCFTGWTSTLMLFALNCNQKGHLYTFDLRANEAQGPMECKLPEELSTGFLIPEFLRERWTLTLSNASDHMMPLLQQEKAIDAFYHDSDHSYSHMMWEYSTVWPHLRPGGLLISDDVGFNVAFWDFAAAVQRPITIHKSNLNFAALLKAD